MNTKVISFLGTAVRPTTYSYQGKIFEGSLFQIALRQFVDFDEMLVFVTPDAREKAYPTLAGLNDPRIKPIDIRTGRTSEGLWQIFETVVANVAEGDTVIFDITHGLRSIPFLTFLVAAYLRSAKNITIEAVLYGAFELGTPAPVIDLSEFVSLLDWLTATNEFIRTGNASALAEELGKNSDPMLHPLAQTVQGIATGLHLLRPKETSTAAARLPGSLTAAQQKLPPPFALLSDRLLQSYGPFGLTDPLDRRTELICQLQMINWYRERGQIVHALSLGREWIISLLCQHFKLDAENVEDRGEMEFLIGGGKQKDEKTKVTIKTSKYYDNWVDVPEHERLRRLWGSPHQLANLRNDVLHSGFRKKPKVSAEVLQAAEATLEELNAIARDLNLSA